ncbi:DUF3822 family protein [Acetobacteroides hydrogenigenes]|uniref:Uncharacterized protein DUF3822 n=1 Tax=Acetobacteroides hydrogenigenes TaxID=979970 RepID=A0A4R2EP91_9BACT|nr:DUF3822 family protein [Acetobacteroides hydrogenigenes]TCN70581.1 uncharacterized protein DUF3822 [Acetobacteroides hydrogenigenes]
MVKQELLDQKLVLEQTEQYKLSIQVSLNGFSFCCMDDRTKRFVALKDYAIANLSGTFDELCFHIERILKEDELLKRPYKEVRCMLVSQMFTLIPSEFFIKEKSYEYLKALIPFSASEVEVHHARIKNSSIVSVYALPIPITSATREAHPNVSFYNQSIPQITKQLAEKTTSQYQLSVFIHDNLVGFSLMDGGKLKIYTAYTIESTSDLVYYALLLLKEHDIKPADIEVYVSGTIEKQSTRFAELSQYLPNLALDLVPKGFEYSYLFKYRAEHQFANLFKLVECE